MSNRTVLISGAGIAGPTLAYWLARRGYQPTLVERAKGPREGGSPVDVRGPAVDVAEQMGIVPSLRAARTHVTELSVVNAKGWRVGRINVKAMNWSAGGRDVELPRGDLATILYEACRDDAEFIFDDSIATISQDDEGVDVTFQHGQPRRFDLLVGADGLHSAVRRLAFGPESEFVQHMGFYIATMPLDNVFGHPHEMVMYNEPGRSVTIHPGSGRPVAAFMFRDEIVPDFDYRDLDQHRGLLAGAFARCAWRVPELLKTALATEDLYFDSVSRVSLPSWSQGRIALLGDSASSLTLFGDGSSLAMAGAYTLAEELAATEDFKTAFHRYEEKHRALVAPKQQGVGRASTLLVPATRRGIFLRNMATHLWPVVAGLGWVAYKLNSRRAAKA